MPKIIGGESSYSSPPENKANPFLVKAFSVVVWLFGLGLLGFIVFNIERSKINWLAVDTWLNITLFLLSLAFLMTPFALFWAARRIISFRNKQKWGWPIAIFTVLTSLLAMALCLGFIFEGFVYRYI